MLTAAKIRIIYCYLICFVMVVYMTFTGSFLINNYLSISYMDQNYVPSYQVQHSKNKAQAAAEEKEFEKKRLHKEILWKTSSLSLAFLILGIHIIMIKRTKE